MKIKLIFFAFLSAFFLLSCSDEAKIQVTNNVHNIRLDNISYSHVNIGTNLFPGETVEKTITDNYNDISFPVNAQLEFYMTKGDKRVYLKTKDFFSVDKNKTLSIVITDDTELINPMK